MSVLWSRFFPFLRWWHLVNGDTVKADLTAGLTNAVIVLPQGVAFAMIIGSVLAYALGNEHAGIELVGQLPQSLPPLSLPDFSLGSLNELGSGALAIAMLGLVEAVSTAHSVGLKSGQRINGNQEFIGQGLANLVGSFFSSYASSGSFTRTGMNYTAGAVTPLAAVCAAIALALIVLLVAPLTAYLPIAAMAGILLLVAYRLIDMHHIRNIFRISKRETAVLLTTFFATLFVELEFAIYVGIVLSLVFYLMRTSRPRVVSLAPDPRTPSRRMVADMHLPRCPQLRLVRIDGSLFFGAVDHVQNVLQSFSETYPEQKHVLIIASGINFIDIAGAEMLVQEAVRRRAFGGGLYIAKAKQDVYMVLQRGGYIEAFGDENIFASKANAIPAIFERLDHERCAYYSARIFNECRRVEYKGDGPPSGVEERATVRQFTD
jgi:SulP family sulfate permease